MVVEIILSCVQRHVHITWQSHREVKGFHTCYMCVPYIILCVYVAKLMVFIRGS